MQQPQPSRVDIEAAPAPADIPPRLTRALVALCGAVCILLLSYKVLMAWRLNINWDEFFFLNHVHKLSRGELDLFLQGAYTHAFRWLTALPGTEADQVVAGRLVMLALLAVTAALIWKLATRWTTNLGAAIAVLCYLSFTPVLHHGGSFRADSLLAPLTIAALVLLTARDSRHSAVIAGACLGTAFVVTVKAVLVAPIVLVLCMAFASPGTALRRLVTVAAAAGAVAALLLGLHWLTLDQAASAAPQEFVARTASKTLLETPWWPRRQDLQQLVSSQPLAWALMGFGFIAAVARRRFALASLALALAPVAFYRNTYFYYYVVMLAPAAVLAGYAVEQAGRYVTIRSGAILGGVFTAIVLLGLLNQGAWRAWHNRQDQQAQQRRLIEGVHAIFPQPVAYIDRCGMIASFRKAGFFMSTWGLENYRAAGVAFAPAALERDRPGFLLANSLVLDSKSPRFAQLLPDDQVLLRKFYLPYWGAVRVAGVEFAVDRSGSSIEFPFPGSFRLESAQPVMVAERLVKPGEIVEVGSGAVPIGPAANAQAMPIEGRFVTAAAQPAPSGPAPSGAVFGPL